MIAEGSAQQDAIAGTRPVAGKLDALGNHADAGGVDEHPVAFAALHHLGVAGDDAHPRCPRCARHGLHNALEVGQWKPGFQDEAGGEMQRPGAGHRQIVHRAMHRQRTDVAAGKEQRRNHVAVGGQGDAAGRQVQAGLIVALVEPGIAERRREQFLDQLRHGPPAAAVAQLDLAVLEIQPACEQAAHARRVHAAS